MKRKINLVGVNTLTVSLPTKWAQKHNLKKGDEVELDEDENAILKIRVRPGKTANSISVNSENRLIILNRWLGSLYKAGYDRIEIQYSTPEELKEIQSLLSKSCIGFEMVEQSKKRVVLEEIAKQSIEEFDKIFKRLFLILLDIGADLVKDIETKSFDELPSIALRDSQVNRCSDFCRRMSNKNIHNFSRIGPIYFVLEQLEKVGDIYRDIATNLAEDRISLNPELISLLKDINDYLREYYEVFYKYDIDSMQEFVRKKKSFVKRISDLDAPLKRGELKYLFYLNALFQSIFDMNGALLTLRA